MNHVLLKSTKIVIVLICLLLGFAPLTFAQGIQVRGKVMDEKGEGIIGASVMQKGATNIGTATDVNGDFTLNVPGDATLVISYLGFISKEVRVNNQANLSIQLSEDTQTLDEVVVTGYGTQKKLTLSGSISTISSKELTMTKNENVVNQLAGKLPGLRITQRSAQPGAYSGVIDLRGFGEPLFVVDGVARDRAYFSRMDSEEIESITLLKDASAAIYGIRASQGVLLITTKQGVAQGGKINISYTGNLTFQEMLFIPDTYTPQEWRIKKNEGNFDDFNQMYFSRKPSLFTDEDVEQAANMKTYEWMERLFKKVTPQTQHNLNVDGGTETLRYFFSMGYLKQDGCYESGSLWHEKYNLRSNVSSNITKDLELKISFAATIAATEQPNATLWDNYKAALLSLKEIPFYANDNPDFLNGYSPWNNEFTNLIGKMDSKYVGTNRNNERKANGSFEVKYAIPGVKGLAASAFLDYYVDIPDASNYKKMYNTYRYYPETDTYELARLENGPMSTIERRTDITTGTDMQLRLNYNNRFGLHSLDATFVFEEIYSKWENYSAKRNLLLSSEYLSAGDPDGQMGSGGGPGDRSQRAYIGRINYDFAGKYILGLIGRYEANSRWPKATRWGFFPSVSVAWRVSEENFIKENLDFISNLKIRASHGILGDESNARDYPDVFVGYETYRDFGWLYSAGTPTQGLRATALPNPNKTWMKATLQNIALDFGLFGNKFSGTIDVFRRDRDGIMGDNAAIIPGTVGANLPQINLNKDRVYGWELELSHNNRIGEVNYFATAQISFTRRMWLFRQETPASNSFDHWRNRYSGRYHNDDFWWLQKSLGMFTSMEEIRNFQPYPIGQSTLPGSWYRDDWNGDGIVDGSDERPLATRALPLFNFGFSLGGTYKNFDLTAQFQGAYKTYMQLQEVFTEALPFGGSQSSLNWYMDRWHPVDPNADLWNPATQWISGYYPYGNRGDRRDNSNGVMDASYVRMKTLDLGYTIPKKLLSSMRIQNLRIFVSGYNLLTFSALDRLIDPERQSSTSRAGGSNGGADAMYMYPNNKTYTIGVNFKF